MSRPRVPRPSRTEPNVSLSVARSMASALQLTEDEIAEMTSGAAIMRILGGRGMLSSR